MATALPLVGNRDVQARMVQVADGGRLHHACLFEGPEGVGKRTFALWLARYVNCEAATRPCGSCRSCTLLLAGTHPDLIVIGPDPERATAVISVQQAQELLGTLKLQRHSARHRFVILDPADLLNDESANTLLKTLEEPPAGTHFFLITARVASLLPTIRSRTQRIRFGPVGRAAMADWGQGRGLDATILAAAAGSPGLALRLAAGEAETRATLRAAVLGAIGQPLGKLFAFTEAEGKRDGGVNHAALAVDVVEELLRDTVYAANGKEPSGADPDANEQLRAWSAALWPGGNARMSQAVAVARDRLHLNVNGRVVLEALLAQLNLELSAATPR